MQVAGHTAFFNVINHLPDTKTLTYEGGYKARSKGVVGIIRIDDSLGQFFYFDKKRADSI